MELFALLGFAGAALMVFSGFDLFGGNDDDEAPETEEPIETEGPTTFLLDGSTDEVTGTDGDDDFILLEGAGSMILDLDAGAGDDFVDLDVATEPTATAPWASTFDLGDGDDTLVGAALGNLVNGGAGDDVVILDYMEDMTVTGGDGDDLLSGSGINAGVSELDGGAGNDTLIGTDTALNGGAGDDVLVTGGANDAFGNFYTTTDGGAGADTISYLQDNITFASDGYSPMKLNGGADGDTFALDLIPGGDTYEGWDFIRMVDGVETFEAVRLGDFTPGEDVIEINADPLEGSPYTFTAARIETEVTDDMPHSTLVLRYEGDGLDPREMTVDLGDVVATWSDIAFVGAQVPVLSPAVA
ncbi:calcium-binding protein [Mesobacterium pallidum]|uniref:calcium-binding protein n=1 Tax=Mesobacterium pallidum TaxID=2872037 RepID=UPI001EE2E493|nr:calcium-binding protein [Mesobacterium pallidum]